MTYSADRGREAAAAARRALCRAAQRGTGAVSVSPRRGHRPAGPGERGTLHLLHICDRHTFTHTNFITALASKYTEADIRKCGPNVAVSDAWQIYRRLVREGNLQALVEQAHMEVRQGNVEAAIEALQSARSMDMCVVPISVSDIVFKRKTDR